MLGIRLSDDYIEGIIKGGVLWALVSFVYLNICSSMQLITFASLLLFWIVYAVVCCVLLYRHGGFSLGEAVRNLRMLFSMKICYVLLVIFSVTLVTALLYPPNNWDAMTYNMPRIMHWIQNMTLAPYITSIDRQIGMAPLQSMLILSPVLLGKTDVFAPLVQWFGYIGTCLAVARICAQLGGSRKARLYAMLFFATVPMCILQASNTESGHVVGFFICCFVSFFLQWKKEPCLRHALWLGAALGLAILSKGSAYPFAAATVLIMTFLCLRNKKRFMQGCVAAVVIIGLQVPAMMRNLEAYDSLFASAEQNINRVFSVQTFIAAASGNFLMNLPVMGSASFRQAYSDFLERLDVHMDDTRIYPWGNPRDNARKFYTTEDSRAQNPLHALLLAGLLLAYLLRRVTLPPLYAGMVVATFMLFSVLLVWFPHITRIHMGLYALAAPCAGLAAEKLRQRWQTGLLVLLLLGALPPLLLNQTRPLLPEQCVQFIWHRDVRDCWSNPREQLYFNSRPEVRDAYIAAADAVAAARPAVVGVRLWQDGWEYPLWGLLRNRMEQLPRVVHVLGENDRPIRAMRESEQEPDVIFDLPETNIIKTQPRVIFP